MLYCWWSDAGPHKCWTFPPSSESESHSMPLAGYKWLRLSWSPFLVLQVAEMPSSGRFLFLFFFLFFFPFWDRVSLPSSGCPETFRDLPASVPKCWDERCASPHLALAASLVRFSFARVLLMNTHVSFCCCYKHHRCTHHCVYAWPHVCCGSRSALGGSWRGYLGIRAI